MVPLIAVANFSKKGHRGAQSWVWRESGPSCRRLGPSSWKTRECTPKDPCPTEATKNSSESMEKPIILKSVPISQRRTFFVPATFGRGLGTRRCNMIATPASNTGARSDSRQSGRRRRTTSSGLRLSAGSSWRKSAPRFVAERRTGYSADFPLLRNERENRISVTLRRYRCMQNYADFPRDSYLPDQRFGMWKYIGFWSQATSGNRKSSFHFFPLHMWLSDTFPRYYLTWNSRLKSELKHYSGSLPCDSNETDNLSKLFRLRNSHNLSEIRNRPLLSNLVSNGWNLICR